MLAITLKDGDEIKIGEDIYVKISKRSGRQTRLYVTAPKSLNIKRIHHSKTTAAKPVDDSGANSGILENIKGNDIPTSGKQKNPSDKIGQTLEIQLSTNRSVDD